MMRMMPDGARVAYRRQGDGPGTVLVHGGFIDSNSWTGLMEVLGRTRTVVAADPRGHGDSDPYTSSYRLSDDVDDLVAIVTDRAAEVGEVELVAVSAGCHVALAAAVAGAPAARVVLWELPGFQATPVSAEVYDRLDRAVANGDRKLLVRLLLNEVVGVNTGSRVPRLVFPLLFRSSFGRMALANALAERWNGARWRIQPTPNRAGGPNLLVGVDCTAASACTAAGLSIDRSGIPQTLAERWNGSRWRIQPTPNPAGAAPSQLGSVSCTSPSACTATGEAANLPLAERWDGATWRIQPTPSLRAGGGLASVSCTSAVACAAVGARTDSSGDFTGTLAERWDGSRWRLQPTPNPPGAQGSALFGLSCTSSSACTATGNSFNSSGTPVGVFAERWNGTKWRIQPVPAPSSPGGFLSGVACTSPFVCTAVGARTDASGNPIGTLAERWNGTRWRIQRTPNPAAGAGLSAVSCTSSSACTAVGGSEAGTLAERWDGTAWRIQPTPKLSGTENFFNGVACKGHACTAVGLHLTDSGPFTLAERWDGTRWRIQPTPKIPGAYDIDPPAVACPAFSSCTAAASYMNNGSRVTLTERWNGTGNGAQPSASGSVAPGSPPFACGRALLLRPPPAGKQTPVSPRHWSQPKTFSTPTSATWSTRLPWCQAG